MHVAQQDQLAFYLTGRLSSGALEPIEGRGLLPAPLAPYRDIAALRHDFPLVLTPGAPARSLSALFDTAVADAGDGEAAERLRGHATRMERALRRLAAEGAADGLAAAWNTASASLVAADPAVRESLDRLFVALPRDGALARCDRLLSARLLEHEWSERQRAKTDQLRETIGTLATGLEDILKADFATSADARTPERLRASMGSGLAASFDFDVMARLLAGATPSSGLDEARRRRIEWLLTVLRTQRFVFLPGNRVSPYGFMFDSCGAALQAWRERQSEVAELARAIAMARLELHGEYNEAKHDPLFAGLTDTMQGQAPGALVPDYLVRVADHDLTPDHAAVIIEALATGLPFKVLVQTDDLLGGGGGSMAALGLRVRPVVSTALGLGDVYVLQAGASQLPGQLARVQAGLAHDGPALFCVYSGAGPATAPLPPYLVSAAAVESRAFPAFAYDPGAGPDWASRFSLDGNPQAERDWPLHALTWEDAAHQRQGEAAAFTLVDFLSVDRRAAAHLARIAPSSWNENQLPVAQAAAEAGPEGRVPFLFMTDAEGGLHKVLADDVLLREARRCLDRWRALQELGGINNSHVAREVAAARLEWTAQAEPAAPAAPAAPAVAALPEADPPPPIAAVAEAPISEPEPSSDGPSIQTASCISCNECIRINDRMFGYDANGQAIIIDAAAGSYRQLVEAAESCQVSVINPGKPLDANESGLEDLLQRAEPFLKAKKKKKKK